MLRKLLILTALVFAAGVLPACAKKNGPQESCNFVQNSESQRVSWGAETPVTLYIDSSVPSVFNDAISAAIENWNRSVGREVLKLGGRINTDGVPRQDQVNVIYYMKTWENDRANEQARTTVYWAGERIYEADVRINARDHDFFWSDEAQAGKIDMESLMVHEFGHVLGLAHTSLAESVMVRSLPTAKLRRQLSSTDLNSIRCEY